MTSIFGILGATLLGLLLTQNDWTQPIPGLERDDGDGVRESTMNESMNLNLCPIFDFVGLPCYIFPVDILPILVGTVLINTSAIALVSAPLSAESGLFGPGAGILLIDWYLTEAIFNVINNHHENKMQ